MDLVITFWFSFMIKDLKDKDIYNIFINNIELFEMWLENNYIMEYDICNVAKCIIKCGTVSDITRFRNMVTLRRGILDSLESLIAQSDNTD